MSRNYDGFLFAGNTYKEVSLYSNFSATAGLTNATIAREFCAHLQGREAAGARVRLPSLCSIEKIILRPDLLFWQPDVPGLVPMDAVEDRADDRLAREDTSGFEHRGEDEAKSGIESHDRGKVQPEHARPVWRHQCQGREIVIDPQHDAEFEFVVEQLAIARSEHRHPCQ